MIASGRKLGSKLREVLGLPTNVVQRIVVDCPVSGAVRVYVQMLMPEASTDDVAAVLAEAYQAGGVEVIPVADVEIDEQTGEVRTT